MKLTTKQIQQIIKEELNNVIKESQAVYSTVGAIQRAFRLNKGSEDEKKKLINKLFDAYESVSPSEREFARRWIDIFYKEYEGFQKIVNTDKLLKYRYFHPPPKPEFVSSSNSKEISDTSSVPSQVNIDYKHREKFLLDSIEHKASVARSYWFAPTLVYSTWENIPLSHSSAGAIEEYYDENHPERAKILKKYFPKTFSFLNTTIKDWYEDKLEQYKKLR